jgi:hypothetical protein
MKRQKQAMGNTAWRSRCGAIFTSLVGKERLHYLKTAFHERDSCAIQRPVSRQLIWRAAEIGEDLPIGGL